MTLLESQQKRKLQKDRDYAKGLIKSIANSLKNPHRIYFFSQLDTAFPCIDNKLDVYELTSNELEALINYLEEVISYEKSP